MVNEISICWKNPFPWEFRGFLLFAWFFFSFFSVSGGDFFYPPPDKIKNLAELEALYRRRDSFRNPSSVCVYIFETVRNEMEETGKSKQLSMDIERYFETFDAGTLPTEDYWHFLRDKALFYQLKGDDEKILETLKRFHLEPPYTINDFHGAAGVKRNTVSTILMNCFKRGEVFRPITVFLSSFDVFTWKERIGGILLLPVFAVQANPHCFSCWIWLVFTFSLLIAALYCVGRAVKRITFKEKKS